MGMDTCPIIFLYLYIAYSHGPYKYWKRNSWYCPSVFLVQIVLFLVTVTIFFKEEINQKLNNSWLFHDRNFYFEMPGIFQVVEPCILYWTYLHSPMEYIVT